MKINTFITLILFVNISFAWEYNLQDQIEVADDYSVVLKTYTYLSDVLERDIVDGYIDVKDNDFPMKENIDIIELHLDSSNKDDLLFHSTLYNIENKNLHHTLIDDKIIWFALKNEKNQSLFNGDFSDYSEGIYDMNKMIVTVKKDQIIRFYGSFYQDGLRLDEKDIDKNKPFIQIKKHNLKIGSGDYYSHQSVADSDSLIFNFKDFDVILNNMKKLPKWKVSSLMTNEFEILLLKTN